MMRSMPERVTESLQKKLSERLHFYEDLGVRLLKAESLEELLK